MKDLLKNLTRQPKNDVLLDQMLVAYRQDARSTTRYNEAIDELERGLKTRLHYWRPATSGDEFALSLDAAILSMRGWLVAFSAVALLLFSLSLAENFRPQTNHGIEEVLTYNAEGAMPDPIAISGEQEYGR